MVDLQAQLYPALNRSPPNNTGCHAWCPAPVRLRAALCSFQSGGPPGWQVRMSSCLLRVSQHHARGDQCNAPGGWRRFRPSAERVPALCRWCRLRRARRAAGCADAQPAMVGCGLSAWVKGL